MAVSKINDKLFKQAWKSFREHKDHEKIKNKDIFCIIDYGKHSRYKRFYVVCAKTQRILRAHHVAHGKGSDRHNTGFVQEFGNKVMSKMTSRGAIATDNTYYGKNGRSLTLHGLEKGVNNNIYKRLVVIHKAKYVTNSYIRRNGMCGMSWGCPAVDPAIKDSLIDLIQGGVFIYAGSSK